MNTEEVKLEIADGQGDAFDLLIEKCPKAFDEFHKHSDALDKLLKNVRKHFPEAQYYTSGGDGFALLLGESHSGRHEEANQDLIALSAVKLRVMGGDW